MAGTSHLRCRLVDLDPRGKSSVSKFVSKPSLSSKMDIFMVCHRAHSGCLQTRDCSRQEAASYCGWTKSCVIPQSKYKRTMVIPMVSCRFSFPAYRTISKLVFPPPQTIDRSSATRVESPHFVAEESEGRRRLRANLGAGRRIPQVLWHQSAVFLRLGPPDLRG